MQKEFNSEDDTFKWVAENAATMVRGGFIVKNERTGKCILQYTETEQAKKVKMPATSSNGLGGSFPEDKGFRSSLSDQGNQVYAKGYAEGYDKGFKDSESLENVRQKWSSLYIRATRLEHALSKSGNTIHELRQEVRETKAKLEVVTKERDVFAADAKDSNERLKAITFNGKKLKEPHAIYEVKAGMQQGFDEWKAMIAALPAYITVNGHKISKHEQVFYCLDWSCVGFWDVHQLIELVQTLPAKL